MIFSNCGTHKKYPWHKSEANERATKKGRLLQTSAYAENLRSKNKITETKKKTRTELVEKILEMGFLLRNVFVLLMECVLPVKCVMSLPQNGGL